MIVDGLTNGRTVGMSADSFRPSLSFAAASGLTGSLDVRPSTEETGAGSQHLQG